MAIFNGDIVADDKLDSKEKTAAASSRGFAGLPQKPEDMQQSTPAASKFMQVTNRRICSCTVLLRSGMYACIFNFVLPAGKDGLC